MKQTYTDKEYFDLKFQTLEEQIQHLTCLLEGNGKPGLVDRVKNIEDLRTGALAVAGALSIGVFLVGIYVRGFIEEVYKHIYAR
jgi:hypothetical protein